LGGTSFSAPQVAGIVALLLSIEPNLTRNQVLDIIRKSAWKVLDGDTVGIQLSVGAYGSGRASGVRALSTVRRGDCNASGTINVIDVNYLVAYLFQGGPEPFPDYFFGDVGCDGNINITDLAYLTNYLFHGGPAPQKPCTVFKLR